MIDINPPPSWVMKAANAELTRIHNWGAYYRVLCAYYGVPPVEAYANHKMKKSNWLACYTITSNANPPTGTIYSVGKEMDIHTALHEFFHHLIHAKGYKMTLDTEQALANSFADAVMAVV